MAGNLMMLAGDALRGDIRVDFLDTLRARTQRQTKLAQIMEMGVPSEQRTERYFYWESAPIPVRWNRGEPIPVDTVRSRSYSVTNYTWARAIPWHEEDEEDDQTGSMSGRARDLAKEFTNLPMRVAIQILRATTDPDLLPSIPNAPDGAAMFSATDGAGANRFGVSGGNIVTQTGTTSAAFRTDFFSAIERISLFQGTKGEPFYGEDLDEDGYLVLYGSHQKKEFLEAFKQGTVKEAQLNVAGAENVGAAGVTNVILDGDMRVTLWSTARLSSFNGFMVFALGAPVKPLSRQVRLAITTDEANRSNSDRSRDLREDRFQAFARFGFGVNLPIGAVSVQ